MLQWPVLNLYSSQNVKGIVPKYHTKLLGKAICNSQINVFLDVSLCMLSRQVLLFKRIHRHIASSLAR